MNNSLIFIFGVISTILCGCGEGGGCKTLSWGDTAYTDDKNVLELKASAGNECGNYNDYYDADITEIISKIQGMKFVKNENCTRENAETGDIEEYECPDFIPETIEFGEITGCSFGITEGQALCMPEYLIIYSESSSSFNNIKWIFHPGDPKFFIEYDDEWYVLSANIYGKTMTAKFGNESLTIAILEFTYSGDEKIALTYEVETK